MHLKEVVERRLSINLWKNGEVILCLSGITEKYAAIDEEDLDVSEIYEMREQKLLIAGPNPVG